MSMLGEFKKFALKGNAIDMAVGIIIGGAFGTIVKSLVDDIIMPPIGMLIGRVDFSQLQLILHQAAEGSPDVVAIRYGLFLNSVISFLIVAFTIFIVIRQMNRIHIPFTGEKAEEAPTTKECAFCCSTIPVKATRCPNCTSEI